MNEIARLERVVARRREWVTLTGTERARRDWLVAVLALAEARSR